MAVFWPGFDVTLISSRTISWCCLRFDGDIQCVGDILFAHKEAVFSSSGNMTSIITRGLYCARDNNPLLILDLFFRGRDRVFIACFISANANYLMELH